MTKKLTKIFFIMVLAGLVLAACGNDDGNDVGDNDEQQMMQFTATVLEIDENSLLVEPVEGEEILRSGDRVSISKNALDAEDTPEMNEGDTVRIFYSGGVMESYPLQLGDIERIELVD